MLKATFKTSPFLPVQPLSNVCVFRRLRSDYASIVLLDRRYLRPASAQALPEWISSHLRTCDRFPQAFQHVRSFFAAQRKNDAH